MKVAIAGIEYYLPEKIENASDLIQDNPDWRIPDIERKTGISRRRIAAEDQTAVDLGILAAEKLFASGVNKDEIDGLLFVTQSPDYPLPTSACIIQDRLGLSKSCLAFDMNLGCSGFVYALSVAGSLIESGVAKKILVICGETYSKYIRKDDRSCRPLFSDAGSAALVVPSKHHRLGPFKLGTDGSGAKHLIVKSGGARRYGEDNPMAKSLYMNGKEILAFTSEMVPKCVRSVIDDAGKKLEDIDLYVFHQASRVVMDNIVGALGLPEEKIYRNYYDVGNTVSATIPIALKDAVTQGKLKNGDLTLLTGFGVGYSWGSCLLRWGQ